MKFQKGRSNNLDIFFIHRGTGKTYVYIKTMFELNKRYGWSKFIVVVPSIAIREGVKKSFEMTQDHFMEHYGKKARFFVYNSSNLHQLDEFSQSSGINVMIINTQAFAASLKEGGRSKDSRIIYSKRDEFGSRRPIDVIAANRPIIIRDEPQKMGGKVTNKSLVNFNPLFMLNYSATHAKEHNLVYVLDALDAYNKRLVKKIEVKGFELKNFRGTERYLYLESIVLSSKKPPMARLEIEVAHTTRGIKREIHKLGVGDDLYYESKQMEQYKEGYTITEIDPIAGTLTFTNGETISKGDLVRDIAEDDMRRIQIRETILSHFEKEEKLFDMGIKTLSLFFIDEVAKYRQYDEDGQELLGQYGKVFEEEYIDILNQRLTLENSPYQKYLRTIKTQETHRGYFSIDRHGRSIDSRVKRGHEFSDDISAYELILKSKERLLSFEEPTRFIFSHSALREGWDNPNVFQICTLKHSDSSTTKRQEVGRGLRLCVSQSGSRMDTDVLGDTVHKINMLTVVASESYSGFVGDLQKQIKEVLYDRPTKATIEYFEGKTIRQDDGSHLLIDDRMARDIYRYLIKNDYVDNQDNITDQYRTDLTGHSLAALPADLAPVAQGIQSLIQAIFDESVLDDMFEDGNKTKVIENKLNDNFKKAQFRELWSYINRKYAYTVDFDSEELIKKAVAKINQDLYVSEMRYTVSKAEQKERLTAQEIEEGYAFGSVKTQTQKLEHSGVSEVKYDLIGKIARGATLTRRTVVKILQAIEPKKLYMFKANPEEFITRVIKLIKEEKADTVIEHITYNQIEGRYDSTIFTAKEHSQGLDKAYRAEKHIQDYVYTDGYVEESRERSFARELDGADEVCVYAKLPSGPKGFYIPTPVGNYSPDWAIAFNDNMGIKHIFFIAETKGSMESFEISGIENAKIRCAEKLFNEMSTSKVRYRKVTDYKSLLDVMDSIK